MGAGALVVCCWLLLALEVVTEKQCGVPAVPAVGGKGRLRNLHLEDCSSPTSSSARSLTPSQEGWNGGGQPWAAAGDSPRLPTSPVSDLDSEAMQIDSPYMIDALAMLDNWQLPPPQHPAQQDSAWQPPASSAEGIGSVASSQEDFSSSNDNTGGRRRCQVCTLVDATRGVADSGEGGEWELLLCRHCAQFMNNTVTLSTRCEQCRRYATFGPYGGNRRSARHCKRHQLPDEVNVARKRCEFVHQNGMPCAQPPLFGDESSGAAKFCAWHRKQHHTNLVEGRVAAQLGRACVEAGCEQAASFGESGSGAVVCSAHRQPNHVDMIHSRRCEGPDCLRHPSYGTRSGGVARFCKAHKPWNFIDLKTKKCQHPFGCTKRPSFGDAAEGIARFCMQHKARPHVNVKSRKCQEQGCAKQPTFGDPTDAVVRFCAVHRRDADVDLVHGRCSAPACAKIASFSLPGEPPQFCFQHKDHHMDRTQLYLRTARPSPPLRAEDPEPAPASPRLLAAPAPLPLPQELPAGGAQLQTQMQAQPQPQPQGRDGGCDGGGSYGAQQWVEQPALAEGISRPEPVQDTGRAGACGPGGGPTGSCEGALAGPGFSSSSSRAAGAERGGGAGMEVRLHGRHSVHNLC